jgi:hypothetical protein
LGITHLAEVLAAVVGNGMMTDKTAARSVGSRKPTAVVPAAKMRVTVAMPAAVVAAPKMRVTEAMPAAVATAMPSTVAAPMTAAAPADRRTRQQRRQNKDRNSDCSFGHGTLRPTPHTLRREEDADGTEKFRGWTRDMPSRYAEGPTPPGRSFRD